MSLNFFSNTTCDVYPVSVYQNGDILESIKTTVSLDTLQCTFQVLEDKLTGVRSKMYIVKYGSGFQMTLKKGVIQIISIGGPTTVSCSNANSGTCNTEGIPRKKA